MKMYSDEFTVLNLGGAGKVKLLRINCYTEQAVAWIEREAPKFGNLFYPGEFNDHYDLFVSPQCDAEAVKQHLDADYPGNKTWRERLTAWVRKTQADYENAYDERFPGTPYSLSATEEREKADRSTAYWQEQYRKSK